MFPRKFHASFRFRCVFLTAAFILFLGGDGYLTHGQDDVIRVDTNLVAVPVSVMAGGRYVDTLRQADFRLFEDEVEQLIEFFGTSDQPVTVVILLDRSGSMTNHLQTMGNAAAAFIKQLKPTDELVVASFADTMDEIIDRTRVSQLPKSIKLSPRFGDSGTRLYDAVDYALGKLKKVKGRKAVIVFSDGVTGATFVSKKRSLKDADDQDATIYTIRFGLPPGAKLVGSARTSAKKGAQLIKEGSIYMTDLAERTGGRSFLIDQMGDLEVKFGEIAAELSQQYTIGYYPSKPGKTGERRRLSVQVSLPNAVVRSRGEVTFKSVGK